MKAIQIFVGVILFMATFASYSNEKKVEQSEQEINQAARREMLESKLKTIYASSKIVIRGQTVCGNPVLTFEREVPEDMRKKLLAIFSRATCNDDFWSPPCRVSWKRVIKIVFSTSEKEEAVVSWNWGVASIDDKPNAKKDDWDSLRNRPTGKGWLCPDYYLSPEDYVDFRTILKKLTPPESEWKKDYDHYRRLEQLLETVKRKRKQKKP